MSFGDVNVVGRHARAAEDPESRIKVQRAIARPHIDFLDIHHFNLGNARRLRDQLFELLAERRFVSLDRRTRLEQQHQQSRGNDISHVRLSVSKRTNSIVQMVSLGGCHRDRNRRRTPRITGTEELTLISKWTAPRSPVHPMVSGTASSRYEYLHRRFTVHG